MLSQKSSLNFENFNHTDAQSHLFALENRSATSFNQLLLRMLILFLLHPPLSLLHPLLLPFLPDAGTWDLNPGFLHTHSSVD